MDKILLVPVVLCVSGQGPLVVLERFLVTVMFQIQALCSFWKWNRTVRVRERYWVGRHWPSFARRSGTRLKNHQRGWEGLGKGVPV